MRYFSHTEEDIQAMLDAIGADRLEDLFDGIPRPCRMEKPPDLPPALSEWDLIRTVEQMAGKTASPDIRSYLGAGRYEHYIPAILPHLLARSEFSTAYTPYQPEISQGTLQAIYEYQTLTARLLGLEVANASLYDGASALAESLFMALRITRRKNIAISRLVHPHYRQVVQTCFAPTDSIIEELTCRPDGTTNMEGIGRIPDLGAVVIQSPNFFGCIEDLTTIAGLLDHKKALLIACFTEPIAFGLLHSPGGQGADIVCGEGQSLGIPVSFGGPGLGMLACRKEHVRNMPGRLVGRTRDVQGREAFVLTLATREQHIRRERATSNICTNSSLCAVTALMFMSTLGGTGMRRLARLNHDKAAYLQKGLAAKGVSAPFHAPFFNEFVVCFEKDFSNNYNRLLRRKVIPGLSLEQFYPELKNHYLFCVTETKSKTDLDNLIRKVTS